MTSREHETVYTSAAQLRATLGRPVELAERKAIPRLDRWCRAYIARAPFLALGTTDAAGRTDVSPRGDKPGFVLVLDDHTLFLPERPGNARYDSLLNIIDNPRVGLLFFVPGFEDMLRVNGRAEVVANPELLARCAVDGRLPRVGIRVAIEEAYLHCAKALHRSRLWESDTWRDRRELPSLGQMILEQTAAADAPPSAETVAMVDSLIEQDYRNALY